MANKFNAKRSWMALLLALLVFVSCILFARTVDNQHGSIDVQSVYFSSQQDGSLMHGRLYIPANATSDTPAPALIYIHGNDGDCDKYSMFSIEFARRGIVVLNIDIPNQGQSVQLNHGKGDGTWGGTEAALYLRGMSFVDSSQICIGGHSLGGMGACSSYKVNPDFFTTVFAHGIGSGSFADISFDDKVNLFLITSREEGDCNDWTDVANIFGYGLTVDEWKPDTVYGSFEEGNARMNFQSMHSIHNSVYVNKECVAETINFIQQSVDTPNPIDGYNQVWQWRYVWTMIALFAMIFILLFVGNILLNTPFFAPICLPEPEYKGNTGKTWWIFAAITALFPPAVYFTWTSIGEKWLPSKIFLVRRAAMTLSWALLVAFVTVGILVVFYFIKKKDKRPTLENYGLALPKKDGIIILLKTFLLGAIIWVSVYALLSLVYHWTLIDVRIWNTAFRIIDWRRMTRLLIYLVPFIFVYLVTAVNLHGTLRPKGGKLGLVKEIIVNILMIAPFFYVWMIWFGPFAWIKQNGGIPSFAGFMYSFFWALPVIMAIVATISTYFFRKTGRVYLGAFVNAWLIAWNVVGGFSMLYNN